MSPGIEGIGSLWAGQRTPKPRYVGQVDVGIEIKVEPSAARIDGGRVRPGETLLHEREIGNINVAVKVEVAGCCKRDEFEHASGANTERAVAIVVRRVAAMSSPPAGAASILFA